MRALRNSRLAAAGNIPVAATAKSAQPAREQRESWREAPLQLRLRAFAGRGRLDRRILAGEPSDSTPALQLRAAQLADPATRRQAARRLRGIVQYVDRTGPRPLITAVVIDPSAVRSGRQAILGLAQRLEASGPVEPRGVVLAQRLLTDGLGPLFNPSSERTVVAAVWETVDALEGRPTREIDFAESGAETPLGLERLGQPANSSSEVGDDRH